MKSSNKISRDKYFNLTELKKRGWTQASIKRFLAEPDTTKANPFYSSKASIKLYLKERVLKAESTPEFQDWFEKIKDKRNKISKALKNRHNEKRQELRKYINSLNISLPTYITGLPKERLYKQAVNDYNELWCKERGECDKFISSPENMDESFLKRISVNMLRHNFTNYEIELYRLFGKSGKDEAYEILRERIDEEIYRNYPFLKQEIEIERF